MKFTKFDIGKVVWPFLPIFSTKIIIFYVTATLLVNICKNQVIFRNIKFFCKNHFFLKFWAIYHKRTRQNEFLFHKFRLHLHPLKASKQKLGWFFQNLWFGTEFMKFQNFDLGKVMWFLGKIFKQKWKLAC